MQLAAGAEVGPYTVERLLGRGGMGSVYAAVERATGRRVALKVSHEPVTGSRAQRFRSCSSAASCGPGRASSGSGRRSRAP